MDIFYIIVLGIAIVLLIIVLAIIGVGMKKTGGATGVWPPVESTCPDYWKVDPTNSDYCKIPESSDRNVGKIYNGTTLKPGFESSPGYEAAAKRVNFSNPYYIACNKKTWAKKWEIYWDGYSNFNGCST